MEEEKQKRERKRDAQAIYANLVKEAKKSEARCKRRDLRERSGVVSSYKEEGKRGEEERGARERVECCEDGENDEEESEE